MSQNYLSSIIGLIIENIRAIHVSPHMNTDANVRSKLIQPMLNLLGYHSDNLIENVRVNCSNNNQIKADYTLQINSIPFAFVTTFKDSNDFQSKHDTLISLVNSNQGTKHSSIMLGILTNGNQYDLHLKQGLINVKHTMPFLRYQLCSLNSVQKNQTNNTPSAHSYQKPKSIGEYLTFLYNLHPDRVSRQNVIRCAYEYSLQNTIEQCINEQLRPSYTAHDLLFNPSSDFLSWVIKQSHFTNNNVNTDDIKAVLESTLKGLYHSAKRKKSYKTRQNNHEESIINKGAVHNKATVTQTAITTTNTEENRYMSPEIARDTITETADEFHTETADIETNNEADTETNSKANIETCSEADIETNSKADTETNSEADTETNNKADTETNSEADTETNSKADIETNSEADIETNSEADIETNNEADTETNNEADTETNSKADIETNNEADTETNNEADIETNSKANIETNSKANIETNSKANIETNSKADTETNSKADTETNSKADTETNSKADTETNSKADTETTDIETSIDNGIDIVIIEATDAGSRVETDTNISLDLSGHTENETASSKDQGIEIILGEDIDLGESEEESNTDIEEVMLPHRMPNSKIASIQGLVFSNIKKVLHTSSLYKKTAIKNEILFQKLENQDKQIFEIYLNWSDYWIARVHSDKHAYLTLNINPSLGIKIIPKHLHHLIINHRDSKTTEMKLVSEKQIIELKTVFYGIIHKNYKSQLVTLREGSAA